MAESYTINQVRQHPKTINRVFNARTRIEALTVAAAATSVDITAALTTKLTAGAYNGANLPLQVANGLSDYTGEGVVTGNIASIFDNVTKEKITTVTAVGDEEVYGRVTEAGGVYTLSFYYLDQSGTEQAVTLDASDYDFEFDYSYKFEDLPKDFATTITSRNIEQDLKNTGGVYHTEVLTATANNVLPDVTYTPVAGENTVKIDFTGHITTEVEGNFTVSGKTITWDPATTGYDILSGEKVRVEYFTYEK